MLLSNCAICGKEKSTFIKNKELNNFNHLFKVNEIINKFSLTWDEFMPDLDLKQPGFTNSVCGNLTKHHEKTQQFRATGNLKNLYKMD